MFFVFFCNILFATFLYICRPKEDEANRWMIVFTISAAIGALSESILTDMIPFLQTMHMIHVSHLLFQLHIYLQFVSEVLSPYAILMYAIVYTNIVKSNVKRMLAYALAIPMIAMLFVTDFQPDIVIDFKILLVWAAPYFLTASWLLYHAWRTEQHIYRRKWKLQICVVLVPVWLGVFVLNYVCRAIDPHTQVFRIVPVLFFLAYVLFITYTIVNGAFGVRIKIEQQHVLDSSIRMLGEGTAILNHTVKNEMSKIQFLHHAARNAIEEAKWEEARSSLELASSVVQSMNDMADRIRTKTGEIVLKERNVAIAPFLHRCLANIRPVCEEKGITIHTQFECEIVIYADDVLLSEVMNNLLYNAIEAVAEQTGRIHVRLFFKKNKTVIEVRDNGIGIPKHELNRVMEPFFSTKQNTNNHGLGLSCCYKIMKAHGGDILIHSEADKGTSVLLQLPQSRLIREHKQKPRWRIAK